MPIIPADIRRAVIASPHGTVVFDPTGPLEFDGDRTMLDFDTRLAARLFVPVATHRVAGVVATVRASLVLEEDPILVQRGSITRTGHGRSVSSPGAQIVMFDVHACSAAKWNRHVVRVAEDVAAHLGLDEVVVEMQRAGLRVAVFGVAPRVDDDTARLVHAAAT